MTKLRLDSTMDAEAFKAAMDSCQKLSDLDALLPKLSLIDRAQREELVRAWFAHREQMVEDRNSEGDNLMAFAMSNAPGGAEVIA